MRLNYPHELSPRFHVLSSFPLQGRDLLETIDHRFLDLTHFLNSMKSKNSRGYPVLYDYGILVGIMKVTQLVCYSLVFVL